MPTVLYEQGFRFSFYSKDRDEPAHIHAEKGQGRAKWWLDPLREARSRGFNAADRSRIRRIIEDRQSYLLDQWRKKFSEAGE